ncbi:XtrA/YqaO family protein [Schinkia azotoformans]|uniref:XtrA/YqaO family protein n=1 Tax=Schinkia azotoformans TaxID=1454 RepID=UPI002DB8BBA4|nr:XtrA/YqaO family protein [Schinkia azotoformans]MEC1714740.1 XtrA/YqaO family protein [Schinkia azotoformans]MEC1757504.1 XtrA/YqaO family protein [Schinkia azotoformans]
MAVNIDKMTAEIDLMKNNILYVIKDGQLIEQELPAYGETVIVTLGGKVDRLETTVKRKV